MKTKNFFIVKTQYKFIKNGETSILVEREKERKTFRGANRELYREYKRVFEYASRCTTFKLTTEPVNISTNSIESVIDCGKHGIVKCVSTIVVEVRTIEDQTNKESK